MRYSQLILWVLCTLFIGCNTSYHVHDASFSDYRLEGANMQSDETVESVLKPYRSQMDEKMNEVLIVSKTELRKKRPESTMGNFASDATEIMAEYYTDKEVDFAIHNYSGIRIGNVGKGDITLGRIYEMMPFDNYLVTVQVSGDEVQQICDFMAERGGWPSSQGLTYVINDKKATHVKIEGKSLVPNKTYTMASNNYVIESAGYFDFFTDRKLHNTNIYVRDALAEYLRSLNENGLKLEVKLDKRVIVQ